MYNDKYNNPKTNTGRAKLCYFILDNTFDYPS